MSTLVEPGPDRLDRTTDDGVDRGFTPLLRQVRAAGLLDRRPGWYVGSITSNVALLGAIVVAMVVVGHSWWQLLLAAPLALWSTRSSFVGHDAGHLQISRSRRSNRWVGLAHGNVLTGTSFGWWNNKHNRHHGHPNDVARDPDVGAGILVWSPAQAATRSGLARQWVRHQAVWFLPLLLLEGLNLKISSVAGLPALPRRDRYTEAGLLSLHYAAYLALVFGTMSLAQGLAFIAVHQALLGFHLGSSFAPNHKGMPMPEAGESWGHLRNQVLTSRTVRGGRIVEWMLGGLNFQVEHHLFATMPRANLRAAQPMVKEYCRRNGVPYTETGLWESYRQALSYLRAVGAAA